MGEATDRIRINRAPVLTLWAAVVAERLGFDRATALTLGQAVAGLSAYAKGVSPRHHRARPDLVRERGARLGEGEELRVDLLGRAVPVVRTPDGLRAVSKGKPGNPAQHREVPRREVWRPPRGNPGGDGASEPWLSSPSSSTAAASGCMSASGRRCPEGEFGWGAKGEAAFGEGSRSEQL